MDRVTKRGEKGNSTNADWMRLSDWIWVKEVAIGKDMKSAAGTETCTAVFRVRGQLLRKSSRKRHKFRGSIKRWTDGEGHANFCTHGIFCKIHLCLTNSEMSWLWHYLNQIEQNRIGGDEPSYAKEWAWESVQMFKEMIELVMLIPSTKVFAKASIWMHKLAQ